VSDQPAQLRGELGDFARRWIVTTAAAMVFAVAIVAGTAVIVVSAAMRGANGRR